MAETTRTLQHSAFAQVNGLKLYYERHGQPLEGQPPLILLHGGVGGIPMVASTLARLSQHRQVIAVELQGHGRTPDVERPLSYQAMADDIAAFLAYLGEAQADVMGYSLGADVALQMAFRYPERVHRLVVAATAFSRTGWYPEVLSGFDTMGPLTAVGLSSSPLAKQFPNVDWEVLMAKLGELLRQDYDWSESVKALTCPTLLIFADADSVSLEHITAFYQLLGGGLKDAGLDIQGRSQHQLAIVPGTNHYNLFESPTVALLAESFLKAGNVKAQVNSLYRSNT